MSKTTAASVVDTDTYDYKSTKIRDSSGRVRTSRNNGDAVAKAMLLHLAGGGDVSAVIKANKLDERMKPHAKKQPGLLRMILGVMLRGMVRNGEPVKIGKITVERLNQAIEMPKVEPAPPRRPAPKADKAAKTPAKKAPRKAAKRSSKAA